MQSPLQLSFLLFSDVALPLLPLLVIPYLVINFMFDTKRMKNHWTQIIILFGIIQIILLKNYWTRIIILFVYTYESMGLKFTQTSALSKAREGL